MLRTAVPLPSIRETGLDPYVDYGRVLTAEGGVLISYKDYDRRFRHTLWRLFAWALASGYEGWVIFYHAPIHGLFAKILCLMVVALLNWLIVRKHVEIYRRIEVRPDCLILEGAEIFWARHMEAGPPSFRRDDEGNQVLSGIYGTRFVDYLSIPRFDELDRAAEVFASHLQEAMQQLWNRPQ